MTRLPVAAAVAVASTVALTLVGCGTAAPSPTGQVRASAQHSATPTGSAPFVLIQPPSAPLRTGERFETLQMPQAYRPVPPNGGTDEYRCFLVDPRLTAPAFLTGTQFLPQNPSVVHHAIMFYVPPDEVQAAVALDASTPGQGWTCFGGDGVDDQSVNLNTAPWVGAWAPGMKEATSPPGLGRPLAAGSRIVLQIHYNLLNVTPGTPLTDQSAVQLRLASGSARITPLQTLLLAAPVELPCPAGQSGPLCDRAASVADVVHRFGDDAGATIAGLQFLCGDGTGQPHPGPTQSCSRPVGHSGVIRALAGHMHLLGRSIKVELDPGTPKARVLLNIPVYNFDNQAMHWLSRPVRVGPTDVLKVTCSHDAALRQELPSLRKLPPRYVVWGDGTSDEMCLGVVTLTNS